MGGSLIEYAKNAFGQIALPCPAYRINAGANAAAGLGNFFVARPRNSFFEIREPRRDKNRMGMGIDESGEDNFAATIYFPNLFAMLRDPAIAKGLFGRTN
jgi:hypothetical protein